MKLTDKGFTLSTLAEYLTAWQNRLKEKYGDDFVIKKEGVIDNLAVASSVSDMELEEQLAFLITQLNPRTATGLWQDKLYSYIGLIRQQATHTVVSRTCEGTANTTITAGTLIIENAATKDQFRLNADLEFDANGVGVGSFTAEEAGAIDLENDAVVNIVTPLSNLTGVYYSSGNAILVGTDYETDEEFRARWQLTSSSANANTEDGLYKALYDLVETQSDVKIFENRTGSTVNSIPAHSQRIVINSPYDDETIAQVIFDNLVDGNMVGLVGDVEVDITDSEGSTETIKFDRATPQNVYLKVTVGIKSNVSLASVTAEIKDSIMNFSASNKFDMGAKIYANMFTNAVYAVSNVTEVTEIKISSNGTSWVDYIQLGSDYVASFDSARITVNEA